MVNLVEDTDYKIVDNFFDENYFRQLQDNIIHNVHEPFPWHFVEHINSNHTDNDTECYFEHLAYLHEPRSNLYYLLQELYQYFEIKSLIRIKANCYPSKENLVTHAPHSDLDFEHRGAIIYLNTNNGFTILEDGTKIESVANRVLFFDASREHSSTNCTDAKARFNINVNYL
jgi:hypothetical protein